jgi:hypothetical protein
MKCLVCFYLSSWHFVAEQIQDMALTGRTTKAERPSSWSMSLIGGCTDVGCVQKYAEVYEI